VFALEFAFPAGEEAVLQENNPSTSSNASAWMRIFTDKLISIFTPVMEAKISNIRNYRIIDCEFNNLSFIDLFHSTVKSADLQTLICSYISFLNK
jgi:hypothetical protein